MTEQEKLRIAVVGSNMFSDYRQMKSILDTFISIHDDKEVSLVFGGNDNVDELAKKYSSETGVPIGRIRHKELASGVDRIIAFGEPEGEIMDRAKQLGVLPYTVGFRYLDK